MGAPEPHELRIGNDERQAAADALGHHFAQGRLEPDEYEERISAAYGARTAGELHELFRDLPAATQKPMLPAPPPFAGPPTRPAPPPMYPQPRYPHPPDAPFGREPATGIPYSDRQKVVAGLLQIFLPFGIGRFYSGQPGIGVAQLITAFFFVGMVWSFIDGIAILAGRPVDQFGRPLR
ncbi:MAG: DUF1707 domain-containing protein [Pseudonocardia sp.]|nr:DUF1707 domain-containing protein [Pseudonocardia sp.]